MLPMCRLRSAPIPKLCAQAIYCFVRVKFQSTQLLARSQNLELRQVVKATVFLKDMADFPKVNPIYAEAFGDHKPARSTVAVAGLPLGALIEIEVIVELT